MDWKTLLRGIAPTLADALDTAAAPVAWQLLADALLDGSSGDAATDEAGMQRVFAAGPSSAACDRLMLAEAKLRRQALALRDVVGPRESLHASAVVGVSVEGASARRTFWFAVLIFCTVAGIEGFLLTQGFPTMRAPELIGRLLGTLDAALLASLYYIFGSSAASVRAPMRRDDTHGART